jgi:hypothetical protein
MNIQSLKLTMSEEKKSNCSRHRRDRCIPAGDSKSIGRVKGTQIKANQMQAALLVVVTMACMSATAAGVVNAGMDLEIERGCGVDSSNPVPVIVSADKGCLFAAQSRWVQDDLIEVQVNEQSCGYRAGSRWTVRGRVKPSASIKLVEAFGPLPSPATPDEAVRLKKIESQIACLKQRTSVHVSKGAELAAPKK